MHILIAPNAFKNSISASNAALAIKKGLMESRLSCSCECFPIGDGGDGTARLILEKKQYLQTEVTVHDPLGREINASYGLIDDCKTAVIELADASGLRLLQQEELDPLNASTLGTGELIKHALDKDVNKIILCIGGSATIDGGTGILAALGASFLDKDGTVIDLLPRNLDQLSAIDLSGIDKRIFKVELIVLCDVENTLLGEYGAAAIFGPQKGANPEDVKKLDLALSRFRDITFLQTGNDMSLFKYGGAAGGVAAGMAAFLKATLVNGIDYFLDITGFNEELLHTDIVITGEGSIDNQTMQGKGPFGVAKKCKDQNIPVIALAGKVPLEKNIGLEDYFRAIIPINNESADLSVLLAQTEKNLTRTAREMANLIALNLSNKKM